MRPTIPTLLGEVAELAQGSRSQVSFRRAVAEHVASRLGFDGLAWTPALGAASFDDMFVWQMPREMVTRARLDPVLRGELQGFVSRTLVNGIAVNAGISAHERAGSALWNEIWRPLGVTSYVGLVIDSRRDPHSLVSIYRMRARPFAAADVRTLRALMPVLAIGDDLCARREHDLPPLALTPREREIAALVERGLTNAEIATVLGISPNTVRNRLVAAFERTGAANRAELVARARR